MVFIQVINVRYIPIISISLRHYYFLIDLISMFLQRNIGNVTLDIAGVSTKMRTRVIPFGMEERCQYWAVSG